MPVVFGTKHFVWEGCVQNAKDTFYELLRGRLAALNPERTVTVRGVTRPGVLVDANEFTATAPMPDCFHLAWVATEIETRGAMPRVTLQCEVRYTTAGSAMNAGLDRGRMLAAMDGELLAALKQEPRNAGKNSYAALAQSGAVVPMATKIWWGDVTFEPVRVERDRLVRQAAVEVMSYQEVGEL